MNLNESKNAQKITHVQTNYWKRLSGIFFNIIINRIPLSRCHFYMNKESDYSITERRKLHFLPFKILNFFYPFLSLEFGHVYSCLYIRTLQL